jgi:hypothetical protein
MKPTGPVHLLAPAAKQGVIDRDHYRRPRRQQSRHHQPGCHQPHLPGTPPRRGEKPVRPTVVPDSGQAHPGQDPAHRPLDRLGH